MRYTERMIRMPQWLSGNFFDKYQVEDLLFIDAGSSNTRVFVGSRQIFVEPTCIAIHQATDSVVAVGKKAAGLLGKTADNIGVSFPIEHGVVAEPTAFEIFLKTLLKRASPSVSPVKNLVGLKGYISIPAGASPVEQQTLREVLQAVGLSGLKLATGIECAYHNLVSESSPTQSYGILNLGGQTAEIGIFSAGELVSGSSFKWGGVEFTSLVQEALREAYSCSIGWHAAEQVKIDLGTLQNNDHKNKARKTSVRGKNLLTQVSQTEIVTDQVLVVGFESLAQELTDQLEAFFAGLPSELVTSTLEQGLYLTGGTSKLDGLGEYLATKLKSAVHYSPQPDLDVIQGMQKYAKASAA